MPEPTEITIEFTSSPGGGRYWVRLEDGAEAYLSYTDVRPGVISADHTVVPPAFRGAGVARKLVERIVTDARAKGQRIVPACSYVEAQFRRHKDWAGLRA